MNLKQKISAVLTFLGIALTLYIPADAKYNVRRTTNADGLSNSAILSLCYDAEGFLWIGTCDGVNIYDGSVVRPFPEMFPGMQLDGNIVEGMRALDNGSIWVQTNYGLNLIETKDGRILSFPQFRGQERLAHDDKGNLFIFAEDHCIYHIDPKKSENFTRLLKTDEDLHRIRYFMWRDRNLWLVSSDGITVYPVGESSEGSPMLGKGRRLLSATVSFATSDGDDLFVVTADNTINSVAPDGSLSPLANIDGEVKARGKISDIIRDLDKNIFVSFGTDGLIKIPMSQPGSPHEDLGITSGVFCLERSPVQDVIWAGSDCQGLYSFFGDMYSLKSYSLEELSPSLSHPVRAIHIDKGNSMWIGTKGDGLLRIDGTGGNADITASAPRTLFTSANSPLLHNEVYAIAESRRPIMWIATDGGVNYYDRISGTVRQIPGGDKVKNIHGIYEENDSTLWLATLGWGVVKASIAGYGSSTRITGLKHYYSSDPTFTSNYFFSLSPSEKHGILFANRGMGAFKMEGDSLKLIPIEKDYGTRTVRDIFSVLPIDDTLWLGSGHGLIKLSPDSEQLFYGPEAGFINSTIHDLREGNDSEIWLSTNKGLVKFNPRNGEAQSYDRSSGLSVMEYSDGAACKTPEAIIFGGIDGISIVTKNPDFIDYGAYNPPLSPRILNISGENVPLKDFLSMNGNTNRITLSARQNHFSVTFTAPDFTNSTNYTFYYSLDGKTWINNGQNNTVTFNQMEHGDYTLSVKYLNRATNTESKPYELAIEILPPWYLSTWAKIIYILIAAGICAAAFFHYMRRQRRLQNEQIERMRQHHKEAVYEEKLRFFTNITHEFCTPLTLMYGPCERIMSYPGSDDYIKKYVRLVQTNTERLNNLIQELIDFRRMETGHKRLKIARFNVSDLCRDIMHSFSDLAERNNIDFRNEIVPEIEWNSDFECIRKTMTNLISNAFKYTPVGGTITVAASVAGENLTLSVYNTGKGIREEDKERIFNRYSVLDNVEENAVKGLSSRNGLGLAICHSMVEMLSGKIEIDSVVGSYARFIVTLPPMKCEESQPPAPAAASSVTAPSSSPDRQEVSVKSSETENTDCPNKTAEGAQNILPYNSVKRNGKPKVLVIDDNREILTLLQDGLGEYQVCTAASAKEGMELLTQDVPDLIITDIMMPGTDGLQLTRQIKGNRHTMHVPLIVLSAKKTNEEKVQGIESGADMYIEKPFSFTYLKAVVSRLLESRDRLREYYNSSASAFDYSDGKLISCEDKETIERINEYIDSNIDDGELTPEEVAEYMQLSLRNLYRKFKDLGLPAPNDYIKLRRIYFAGKMLVTTSLTVQEIIYRCGFVNRSHFYKEFDKVFHCRPKDYRATHKTRDESLA